MTDSSAGQFELTGTTNINHKLSIGMFDDGSVNSYGYIFATQQGSAYRNLILNGLGGNVGIGTTAPGEKLEVNGNIKATGYKSSDGTIGTSTTINVRKADDSGACTITVKNGLVTATTCP